MIHLFVGLVCVILDSVVCAPSYFIYDTLSFGLQSARGLWPSSQEEVGR